MMILLWFLLLHAAISSPSPSPSPPRCHEDEKSALLEFKATYFSKKSHCCDEYHSESRQPVKLESWKAESGDEPYADCCAWDGVECDEVSGHVIGLDLSCACLFSPFGSNTSSIFRLHHLQRLNLALNNFSSSHIPFEVGNLCFMSDLNLSISNFLGQIPLTLGNLTQLTHLDLSRNSLFGPIPSQLRHLTQLIHLDLSMNSLSGTFPSYVGNFSRMKFLDISYNRVSGKIPPSLRHLVLLEHLNLGFSTLTGEMPSYLENFTRLTFLDLSGLDFVGQIPLFLGNLIQLTDLNLGWNQFIGKIPSSFLSLIQLTHINLSLNQLTGEIPSSLGNLVRLTELYLSGNKLTGEIPFSFKNLLKLQDLDLSVNELTGEIPSLIARLTNLIYIDLSFNKFYGQIPSAFTQLQRLTYLTLNSNNLSGALRLEFFSNAQSLVGLELSFNKLSLIVVPNITKQYDILGLASCNLSSFPKFLQYQDGLQELDLSNNNISGPIPKWFLNVSTTNLQFLNLSSNFLTSFSQDPVIFKWTNLLSIDLRSNELQGSLPIPNPQVSAYYISNNHLFGQISPLLCNLSFTSIIDFSNNNLFGELPQCLGNLSGTLKAMSLHSNRLHGKIPRLNKDKCVFLMIDLSYNQLQGPLPRELANCKNLEFLNLGNNQIGDTFPSWLRSVLVLRVLILRSNRFHGVIGEPTSNLEFPMLQIIDLSQNNFFGRLPLEYFKQRTTMQIPKKDIPDYMSGKDHPKYMSRNFGHSPQMFSPFGSAFYYSMTAVIKGIQMNYSKIQMYLNFIDLSFNNFNGTIPKTVGSLKLLQLLNLSNNNLTGPLPLSLAKLSNLESLDLSRNQLNGEIPQELTRLTFLAFFNVSYNHLIGPIPQSGQFGTFGSNSYLGNLGLCEAPLSKKCGEPKGLPQSSCTSETCQDLSSSLEIEWKIVSMGYISGLVIGVVMGHCLITRRRAHWLVDNFEPRRRKNRRLLRW